MLKIDVKPIGAFVEYTLKPLIDDSRELMELMKELGIPAKDLTNIAVWLFVYDKFMTFIQSVLITSIIAWATLKILSSQNIAL